MQSDELKRRISAGRGGALADLVLKNARIVPVFIVNVLLKAVRWNSFLWHKFFVGPFLNPYFEFAKGRLT